MDEGTKARGRMGSLLLKRKQDACVAGETESETQRTRAWSYMRPKGILQRCEAFITRMKPLEDSKEENNPILC